MMMGPLEAVMAASFMAGTRSVPVGAGPGTDAFAAALGVQLTGEAATGTVEDAADKEQEQPEEERVVTPEQLCAVLAQPIPQPIPQPIAQPIALPSPEPIAQPIPQSIAQPIPQPTAQPIPLPTPQPTAQPLPQPNAQPILLPNAQPLPQPHAQPLPQPIAQSFSHPIPQPLPQQLSQPLEPSQEAVVRPLVHAVDPAEVAIAPTSQPLHATEQDSRKNVTLDPTLRSTRSAERVSVPRSALAQLEALDLPIELRRSADPPDVPTESRAPARLEPTFDRSEPVRDRFQPERDRLEPGRDRFQPGRDRFQPGRDGLEPVRDRFQRDRLEPTRDLGPSPQKPSGEGDARPVVPPQRPLHVASAERIHSWVDALREPLTIVRADGMALEEQDAQTGTGIPDPLFGEGSSLPLNPVIAIEERAPKELAAAPTTTASIEPRATEAATRERRQEDAESAVNRMTLGHGVEAKTTTQELGTVTVKARTRAEGIELEVVAERQETASLIAQDRGVLLENLSQNNVSVSGLEIRNGVIGAGQSHVGGGTNGFDAGGRGRGSESSARGNGKRGASRDDAGSTPDLEVSRSAGRRVRIVL